MPLRNNMVSILVNRWMDGWMDEWMGERTLWRNSLLYWWLKQVSTLSRNLVITRIDTKTLYHIIAMLWCHMKHQLLLNKMQSFL